MAPSGKLKTVERKVPESGAERTLRCSYFLQCAYYKDGSPYCSDQPSSCPKWRENMSSTHENSDFSDNLVDSPRMAKSIHVVTPYGKFEHNLHLYEFEAVGEELVVYPLDGSGGSFHYRGSFLYYVEGDYRR
jgi:hypothetical protein